MFIIEQTSLLSSYICGCMCMHACKCGDESCLNEVGCSDISHVCAFLLFIIIIIYYYYYYYYLLFFFLFRCIIIIIYSYDDDAAYNNNNTW